MPSLDLNALLRRRQQEGRLAPFYLICHPDRQTLSDWCLDFTQGLGYRPYGDDLIQLTPPEEGYYRIQDLEDFFHFAHYPPARLPWKYLFLQDPHAIPPLLAHKILKTLEEGPPRSSIFFLCHREGKLLETIRSRAIMLRLPRGENRRDISPPEDEGGALAQFLSKGTGLTAALEEIKSKEDQTLIPRLLDHYLRGEHSGLAHGKFLESLQHFAKSEIYHNSPRSRYTLLLHAIGKNLTDTLKNR